MQVLPQVISTGFSLVYSEVFSTEVCSNIVVEGSFAEAADPTTIAADVKAGFAAEYGSTAYMTFIILYADSGYKNWHVEIGFNPVSGVMTLSFWGTIGAWLARLFPWIGGAVIGGTLIKRDVGGIGSMIGLVTEMLPLMVMMLLMNVMMGMMPKTY